MSIRNKYLMCRPEYFDVSYIINPWMEGNLNRASSAQGEEQWQALYQLVSRHAKIELVQPQPGLPDLPFTANAGFVLEDKVLLSRFFHPERQGEEAHFEEWFTAHDFKVFKLPPQLPFEGAGDALLDRELPRIWAGYGHRSVLESHAYLARWLEMEVISLRLVDDRFYHLDTCFCPLEEGYVMYYPMAFDETSRRLIARHVPEEKRIVVLERDAINFACNAVNIGRTVILNQATPELVEQLGRIGFEAAQTGLTEFLKAGGSAKCLTLRLNELRLATSLTTPAAVHEFAQRTIDLEGHLLDANLMNRAMDRIVEGGGAFEILEFRAGARQQDISRAKLMVTAPTPDRLEDILGSLIEVGARLPVKESADATLELVQQAGVAPDEFYVTTIYPTEVRIRGGWRRVQGQRMGATIVVDNQMGEHLLRCQLIHDLQVGQKVVCGNDGIRTIFKREGRETTDFNRLGSAGITSERRVELAVEQTAWEMRRLRDQGGKVVVVAGPVVIHSGAGKHLAQLIHHGYVQALLGGNAIAAYDVEQALYGTSLGIDLQRGAPIRDGNYHHLKAVNRIRACGGITPAVKQGVLTSGIFYECVQRKVPFVLAGSIRDDGPLPETQMDLNKAQEQYDQLLQNAQMVLTMASMLHGIGVNNMLPAEVKVVSVDINPLVVNQSIDRNPAECIGIVTDIGLFLSMLARQLLS